jgi:hypothetical protein
LRLTSSFQRGSVFVIRPLHISMTNGRQIPTVLSVVSYLFLIMAVLSVIDIAVSASRGHIHPNFGFLGLWVFDGLRRYSRMWRTCALVFIWLGFILYGSVIILFLCCMIFNTEQVIQAPPFNFNDIKTSATEFVWPLIVFVLLFVLQLWQYRVLTRPKIRSLFYRHQRLNQSGSTPAMHNISPLNWFSTSSDHGTLFGV